MELTQEQINSMATAIISIKKLLGDITTDTMSATVLSVLSQIDVFNTIVVSFTNQDPVESNQTLQAKVDELSTTIATKDETISTLQATVDSTTTTGVPTVDTTPTVETTTP